MLIALILIAAVAAAAFDKLISREIPTTPPEATWVVRQAGRFVQRVRTKMPDGIDETEHFPRAVTLTWPYEGAMPAKGEVARLDRFEDALETLEDAGAGFLMFVTTGEGRRTWTWFVRDERVFAEDVRAIDEAKDVTFAAVADPKWDAYTRMRRSMM
jgi:hypothetical protein